MSRPLGPPRNIFKITLVLLKHVPCMQCYTIFLLNWSLLYQILLITTNTEKYFGFSFHFDWLGFFLGPTKISSHQR